MVTIRPHGDRWIEDAPRRCPNGHRLAAGTVLVGWDSLRVIPARTWTCRTCGKVIVDDQEF